MAINENPCNGTLDFTYQKRYNIAEVIYREQLDKVDDLIYYQDIEKDIFEVEDIIVTRFPSTIAVNRPMTYWQLKRKP